MDESVYKKAVQSGTVFKSKTDAVNDFKSKNASKFANKFDAEPAARPSYIPASTSVGGNTYNVSYNSQHHGYGYYGPSGAWIAYDALRDVAMLSVLMDHDNYVVAPPNSTVVHHSMGFIGWFFTILVVAVLIGSAIIVFSSR